MKPTRSANNKQSKQGYTNKPRPEIRDDLDSRENEEFRTVEDLQKGKKNKQDKSREKKRQ